MPESQFKSHAEIPLISQRAKVITSRWNELTEPTGYHFHREAANQVHSSAMQMIEGLDLP